MKINKDTREKVLQIARDLKYRPNLFARSLKTKKTNCIGILRSYYMRNAADFYTPSISDGVEERLAGSDSPYTSMLFGSNSNTTYEKSMALIEQNMVDGLVIVAVSFDLDRLEQDLFPRLTEAGIPFVVIHTTGRNMAYHNVGADIQKAGVMAADYLVQRGYTEPGFFLARPDSVKAGEMLEAFKKTLHQQDGTWKEENLIANTFIPGRDKDVIKCARETVRQRTSFPRAILVPWARMAELVAGELKNKGLRVPEDVAIISTEDETPEPFVTHGLTTINFDLKKKGYEGTRILTGLLEGTLDKDTVQTYSVEPKLVVRTSCGEQLKRRL